MKVIQFQYLENGGIIILLDNGKIYKKDEHGGPWYWKEIEALKECSEYLGEQEMSA